MPCRTITFEYPAAPDEVAALLRDPEFLRRRCEAAGERNVEVTLEETDRGLRVVVARDRVVDLPAFAKKLFSSQNRVVDDTLWTHEGDRWVGRYAIEIRGVPGDVRGTSEITPAPAGGSRYESRFEVMARVPLFASKLEAFVADKVEETLRANARRNAELLSS